MFLTEALEYVGKNVKSVHYLSPASVPLLASMKGTRKWTWLAVYDDAASVPRCPQLCAIEGRDAHRWLEMPKMAAGQIIHNKIIIKVGTPNLFVASDERGMEWCLAAARSRVVIVGPNGVVCKI